MGGKTIWPNHDDEQALRRLRDGVTSYGLGEACVELDTEARLTFAELVNSAELLKSELESAALTPGDAVAIHGLSATKTIVTQLACMIGGFTFSPINPHYRTNEVQDLLARLSPKAILHSGIPEYSDTISDRSSTLDCGLHIMGVGKNMAERSRRPAIILWTSGTSGTPKGVMLSLQSIVHNAQHVGARLQYTAGDRLCLPVALYHCFGLVLGNLAAMLYGCTTIVPSASFSANKVLHALMSEKCTVLYGVPTMYSRCLSVLKESEVEFKGQLRTGMIGGAHCSPKLVGRVIRELGLSGLTCAYGMTETSPISIQTHPGDLASLDPDSIGTPLPGFDIRLRDPDTGRDVRQGSVGELLVKGAGVMLGYLEHTDASIDAVDDAGWLATGDLALLDSDGHYRYRGRLKEIVIVGGENVSPASVELVLEQFPAIASAYAFGIRDEEYGERVAAWIVPESSGRGINVRELADYALARLGRLRAPVKMRISNEVPTTDSGKVSRSHLSREYDERDDVNWIQI